MADFAKILVLQNDSAAAAISFAEKSSFRSVRLIKNAGVINPGENSYDTTILLNGKCIDKENRKLYLIYIDSFYNSAWIIEIDIDSRTQNVVLFDRENKIGFNPKYWMFNPRVVHGKLIFTDDLNDIRQIDISRAKRSFLHGIGYNENENVPIWNINDTYNTGRIVAHGRYFFKSLSPSTGENPFTYPNVWSRLCMIQDAYYSIKPENFLFAPMPPTEPPVVRYLADDTRKINNLRQTLYQFAYQYVYMDYRKSTFSPASEIAIPNAEEEVATGQANEQISLNNTLEIKVNSGTEEVRKIRIIGRSSVDPSKWFLVEEIDKFSVQEDEIEESDVVNPWLATIEFIVMDPIVINSGICLPDPVDIEFEIPAPAVLNAFISSTQSEFSWLYVEYGSAVLISCNIYHSLGNNIEVVSFPSWLTIINTSTELPIAAEDEIASGTEIGLFPSTSNPGEERAGIVLLRDSYNDTFELSVTQLAAPPVGGLTIHIHEDDTHSLSLYDDGGNYTIGSTRLDIYFGIENPAYGELVEFTLNYQIYKNSVEAGSGTMIVRNMAHNNKTIYMTSAAASGDDVEIVLWIDPLP